MQEQLHTLREMFPQVDLSRIEEVMMIYGVEDGVGVLLEEAAVDTSPADSVLSLTNQSSLQSILFEHAHHVMDHSHEIFLKVNKDTLWQQALTFYKELKSNEKRARRDLTIQFDGEEGSNAGALKIPFLEMMLQSLNDKLFEG